MDNSYILGIDCGGTNIRLGLVSNDLNILNERKYKSLEHAKDLFEIIKSYFYEYKNNFKIIAVSIGFPGIVDNVLKKVIHTPNLRAFEQINYKVLEEILKVPIFLGNDTNNLLLYDAKHFKIDDNKSILGFYVGTGFGNAIRIKDKIYEGEHGVSGEIGHVPAYLEGIDYNNKQRDLESFVSGFNLIEIHKKHFSSTPFNELFIKHIDDPIIKNFIYMLAFYIVTEITILDISTIILGGGVISSKQFPKSMLVEIIKNNMFARSTLNNLKIHFAEDEVNSGILGAAIYARGELK